MDWSHSFCLTCDRQTDGNVYCSEACRLAEYEDSSSSTSSTPSSPSSSQACNSFSWPISRPQIGQSPISHPPLPSHASYASHPHTSPCKLDMSSQRSKCHNSSSLTSTTCTTPWDMVQLSEESKRALRGYANSFDQSRYSRRKSGPL